MGKMLSGPSVLRLSDGKVRTFVGTQSLGQADDGFLMWVWCLTTTTYQNIVAGLTCDFMTTACHHLNTQLQ